MDEFRVIRSGETFDEYVARAEQHGHQPLSYANWWAVMEIAKPSGEPIDRLFGPAEPHQTVGTTFTRREYRQIRIYDTITDWCRRLDRWCHQRRLAIIDRHIGRDPRRR